MSCRHVDVFDPGEEKSFVKTSHGCDEVVDEDLWAPVEDFVSDEDVVDLCPWVEWIDVVSQPAASVADVGETGDLAVRHGDGDEYPRVGEGPEDVWVDIKKFDTVDGRLVFEERGDLIRRREVVPKGTVVNTYAVHGGDVEYDD